MKFQAPIILSMLGLMSMDGATALKSRLNHKMQAHTESIAEPVVTAEVDAWAG